MIQLTEPLQGATATQQSTSETALGSTAFLKVAIVTSVILGAAGGVLLAAHIQHPDNLAAQPTGNDVGVEVAGGIVGMVTGAASTMALSWFAKFCSKPKPQADEAANPV